MRVVEKIAKGKGEDKIRIEEIEKVCDESLIR